MKRFIAALIACLALVLIGQDHAIAAATILPPGETCFSGNTGTTGMVGALGTITGGAGGTAGTYGGVALTGGSGSGATANITVAGGVVTAVTILNPGTQYVVADVLSAVAGTIGGTVGFSVPVNSVSINSALAGGSVAFYIPSTNTFKQTWKDAAQTVLNTNPAALDANGCLIAYGTGSYRQVVKDSLGNTIWDQVTADTSSYNGTFWAGNAGGTPNAITVIDPGFNATDGTIINFVPVLTNTGATTLNPSSFGNVPIVKDTTGGYVALVGGEIVAPGGGLANVVSVIYNATQNNFHLLNTVIASASGATAPLCGATGLTITNSGTTPNSQIVVTADQAVMQTTAGLVINRSTISQTINITTGTATSAANGMDGEAPGTSAWLDLFLIDNGSAPAGLASLASGNGATPNMPSGYTYKCLIGAMRVEGAGNLMRTIQKGKDTQYVVSAATTTNLVSLITGASGNITIPTWTAASVTAAVPPIATSIDLVLNCGNCNTTGVMVAPNNLYGVYNSTTNPPSMSLRDDGGLIANIKGTLILESTNVYYASSSASAGLFVSGWKNKGNLN